ncbi:hypothetical protein KM043_000223 [Ampulex compressa]|nr:hypothetical protein KM043_000223 [Ampulex compressa]
MPENLLVTTERSAERLARNARPSLLTYPPTKFNQPIRLCAYAESDNFGTAYTIFLSVKQRSVSRSSLRGSV